MNQIVAENKKLQSDIAIVKNVNRKLEDKIVYLKKNQAKGEQYSHRNNMEISGIPNTIPDNDLENTVISICRLWSGDRSEGYRGLSQIPNLKK